jgi:peptidoglycan/LPS O-acetylase OafA/YrhL
MTRMACEFTAGCLLYAAVAKGWRLWVVPSLSLMFVFFGVGVLLPSCGFLMVFAFAFMVVLAAQGQNIYPIALQWRPVLFLGEISFSLYLTHWIIIQVFNWLGSHGLHWETTSTAIATLLFTLVLSTVTFHLIEAPARKWGRLLALTKSVSSDSNVALASNR